MQKLLNIALVKIPLVVKGKRWSVQEESELKALIESNTPIETIAIKLAKTPGAVIVKSQRLGLKPNMTEFVKTSVSLPRELPSVEEALKMLAGALKTAIKPGLDRVEVQRIQAVATIAKTYKELLTDYINYRQIEAKLKEMEELNAQLLKERAPNTSPQPDSTPMA